MRNINATFTIFCNKKWDIFYTYETLQKSTSATLNSKIYNKKIQ